MDVKYVRIPNQKRSIEKKEKIIESAYKLFRQTDTLKQILPKSQKKPVFPPAVYMPILKIKRIYCLLVLKNPVIV